MVKGNMRRSPKAMHSRQISALDSVCGMTPGRALHFFILAAACSLALIGTARAESNGSAASPAGTAPSASGSHPGHGHWSVIEEYCLECHNAEDWAGGLAFDTLTPADVPENPEIFEKTIRKLRGRLMPPPGRKQPDSQSLWSLVAWMENTLDQAAANRQHPGRVGLHRLNRREYANAVHDLLDLRIDPAALLPRDDTHAGFDNIATALQVSPSFMDQYISAAQKVAELALGNPKARPVATTYTAQGAGTQQFHRDGLPFGTRGGVVVEHYFPADGEYELSIANMAGALWVQDMEFENTVVALLDGKEFYRTTIGGEEDMKAIDQEQDPAVDRINQRLKNIRFRATAGQHRVAVTFLQRTHAESDNRLHTISPIGLQDRIKRLTSFEIRGPYNPEGVSETPSRRRVFICYPQSAAEERPCAESIVRNLATRAFRGMLDPVDFQGLMRLYEKGRSDGDFEQGIRYALAGILASPSFLYRAALGTDPGSGDPVRPLTDHELASRLSFFLWSSVPDEELLKLADEGRLREPGVLEQQVRRMLADPRSISLVTSFAFQWLNLPKLDEITPDPRIFPYAAGFNDLRDAFREELKLFIDSVFRSDSSVLDLLTADYTFVNERLALHYGIRNVKGDHFRRVKLENSARYGLLGKGAVLMLTSYPNRTTPVLRGAWVLERVMGTPPAPPPPNVEALDEKAAAKPGASVREVLALHSAQQPACFACHGVMDPLGFALENFDAVGQYREIDRHTRAFIDASGKLPDGRELKGPDDLRNALVERPEQFVQTLTEKLMTYAIGRPLEAVDMPLVRSIVRKAAQDGYRFSSIVTNIVTSDAFQKTTTANPQPAGSLQAAVKQ